MGSKPSSQQNTSSSYTPPPQVLQNYQQVTSQAQGVAATPYSAYGGQLVSPINAQQQTGIGAVNSASGIEDPYNTGATGLAGASASAINPTAVNGAAISQYESPYQSDVINATEAEIQNQNQQQAAALQGNSIASGSFGGDRAGVAQAALAGQQDIASNATIANLNNQNYAQALGEANTQQGIGLSAAQNTAARQLAASQQLGTLGSTAQTEALNEANAQTNAGTLEQTTQQAQDTAAYNQFLQQQAYPFETTGWLANIVEGIGSQSGGTSTGQTTNQTSTASQYAGAALGLASFLKRGGRVPHRASGGGLGGAMIIAPNLYNPTAAGGPTGLGGGSYVPQINLQTGHTMPTSTGASTNPAAQTPQQQGQSIAQTAKAVQTLGSAAQGAWNNPAYGGGNALEGDAFGGSGASPLDGLSAADYGAGFRRGGPVRHYDGGGLVPDDNSVLFDPNAMGGPSVDSALTPAARVDQGFAGMADSGPNVGLAASPPIAPDVPLPAARPATANNADPTFGRMIQAESNGNQFNTDGSPLVSGNGAVGIAQVMPGTGPEAAQYAGVPWDPNKLATDPQYNLALGKAYYQHQLSTYGSPDLAAAAYNAGPGRLNQALAAAAKNGGSYLDYLPPETQAYVAKVTGGDPAGGALAFDNQQPSAPVSSPGLKAIGNALLPSDNGTQTSAPQFPDSTPTPPSGRTGLLGLNLSPETRQLMLSAGLGIMGGTSRSALTNIGQGGLKGIQQFNANRTTAADVGLKGAQTQQALTETAIKQQQLQLMMKALEANQKIFAGSQSSAAPSVETPTVTAPTIAPTGKAGGAPSTATAPQAAAPAAAPAQTPAMQVSPQYDPVRLRAAAENMSFVNPAAAANYRDQAEAIESGKAQVQFADGHWGYFNPQAGIDLAAQKSGAEAAAGAKAKLPYETTEIQPTPGGPTYTVPKSQVLGVGAGSPPGSAMDSAAAANPAVAKQPAFYEDRQKLIAKNEQDMLGQMQVRQLSRQRLQALQGIMQTFQPGTFAEQKANIVASLRAVGIPVPDSATANPAAFQEFTKNAIANVFNDVKAQGGRVMVSEILGLTKANANPELQPAAAAAIIGQGLGVLNYEDQHTKDYFTWKQKNPNAYDTSSFEIPWMQSHPVSEFVGQANKGIAYSGQEIPAPPQRVVGQSYMTPKGPAVWRGNGWQLAPAQ